MRAHRTRSLLPEQVLDQLRNHYVVEWMSPPALSCPPDTTVDQLVDDILLPNTADEVPVIEPDGTLLGLALLDDLLTLRTPWTELRVRDIMRPLNRGVYALIAHSIPTLKPQQDLRTAIEMLLDDETEAPAIPVVSERKLVGEFQRKIVSRRLQRLVDEVEARNAGTPIRFRTEKPVLNETGTRVGRLTRLVVNSRDFTSTNLAVRLDGLRGREIVVPAVCVKSWGGVGIRTTLSNATLVKLPDFAPVSTRSPDPTATGEDRFLDSVCLDHRTHVWAGSVSLGRLTEFELDAQGKRLAGIVYSTGLGLLFHQDYFLPMEAVVSMTEARIDAESPDSGLDAEAQRLARGALLTESASDIAHVQ